MRLRFSFDSYLITLHQRLPTLDKPLPHDILQLSFRIRILVEDIRNTLIAVFKEGAKTRSSELVKELIEAGLRRDDKVR